MSTAPFDPERRETMIAASAFTAEFSHGDFRLWQPTYRGYNSPEGRDLLEERIDSIVLSMREMGIDVDISDVQATKSNMDLAYNQYQNPDGLFENGHVFTAPTRISATDFTSLQEAYRPFPILSAIENSNIEKEEFSERMGVKVSRMLELCPPMIMETYDGAPGAIVFCPITSQIGVDFDRRDALTTARQIASDTASFAKRGGASVLGLGATLPSLTGYGKYIEVDGEMAITTGHAGTAVLVGKLIRKRVEQDGRGDSNPIALIGSGAMGSVIAEYILSTGRDVVAYDEDPSSMNRMIRNLGADKITPALNLDSALSSASIIISAVTRGISLKDSKADLSGKLIIDDSQPGAFSKTEVEALGGELSWVVGRASFLENSRGWSYADTIHSGNPNAKDAVFGCEAESAVIARLDRETGMDPREFTVRGRSVTIEDISKMEDLFDRYGVEIAPSQSFGVLNN